MLGQSLFLCLYIIVYSHTNRIFKADLRINFSSYLYILIIFMFTCCSKSFVLVYCNCFYYACIHIIVSYCCKYIIYIHARFRLFKAYLRVAFRQGLYILIFVCVNSFVLVFCICFNQCLLLSRSSCSFCPHTPLALILSPCFFCSQSPPPPMRSFFLSCSHAPPPPPMLYPMPYTCSNPKP